MFIPSSPSYDSNQKLNIGKVQSKKHHRKNWCHLVSVALEVSFCTNMIGEYLFLVAEKRVSAEVIHILNFLGTLTPLRLQQQNHMYDFRKKKYD